MKSIFKLLILTLAFLSGCSKDNEDINADLIDKLINKHWIPTGWTEVPAREDFNNDDIPDSDIYQYLYDDDCDKDDYLEFTSSTWRESNGNLICNKDPLIWDEGTWGLEDKTILLFSTRGNETTIVDILTLNELILKISYYEGSSKVTRTFSSGN